MYITKNLSGLEAKKNMKRTINIKNCSTIALVAENNNAFVFVNTKDLARKEEKLVEGEPRLY